MRGFIDAAASSVPGHPVAARAPRSGAGGHLVGRGGHHGDQPRLRDVTTDAGHRRGDGEPRSARSTRGASSPSRGRRLHPLVHAQAGQRRVADHRSARRPGHPRARLPAALRPRGRRLLPRPDRPARRPRPPLPDHRRGPADRARGAVARAGRRRPWPTGVRNPLAGVQLRRTRQRLRPDGDRRPDRPGDRSRAGAVGDLRAARVDAAADADQHRRHPRGRQPIAHPGHPCGADRRRLDLLRSRRHAGGRGRALPRSTARCAR